MSKQSEAKEKQGFLKKSPTCSNCKNFTFDKQEINKQWSSSVMNKERNLRCGIGNFKIGKSNWCKEHNFKE